MAVIGVVAEYNPFHSGHRYHLRAIRRVRPDGLIVCCMSGNWVQRGECAVTDKWTRARRAVEGGADLVIELPTVWATASAETFAEGAVTLLTAAGADVLSFGCEDPDLPRLRALATCLNGDVYPKALAPHLKQGMPFPAARQRAVAELVGEDIARLLEKPNNNLAVEYLRAAPSGMGFLPIGRTGAHDGPAAGDQLSGSALRQLLREGRAQEAAWHLPGGWTGPVRDMTWGDRAVVARLRELSPADWSAIPDSTDGLAQRLFEAARQGNTFREICALAKSRQLTLSRVRRVALWGFLGLTASDRPETPGYLRVLAMSPAGRQHLARLKGKCPLLLITKPAQFREELALEARLTDLYGLFSKDPEPCGMEFRQSPVLVLTRENSGVGN